MYKRSATLIVAFFALMASVYSDAQEPQGPQLCFSSKVGHRNAKWYRHQLGIFSICIPETLTRRRTARCGEKCYIFENGEMYFDTDMSGSAWRPTFQKRYPSFTNVSKPIDGKQSTIWFFEDYGEYKFVAGVNVIFDRGQIGMGAYLFSRSADPKPIAEKMFGSIKFTRADAN